MAQCFFGHFGVRHSMASLCLQCRFLPCIFIFSDVFMVSISRSLKVSPIWDQHRQRHSAPREPESKHSTVEPSNCNICCRTRRYNCCAVASDELTGWESYSLSYLLVLSTIPLSVIQISSPFFFHLLFPTFSLLFLRLLFTTEVITSQFSSLTVLQRFLISCTQGTQQWRCSKARCLQIPRLWVEKNTTNHKCRPFLLQAVSAKIKYDMI